MQNWLIVVHVRKVTKKIKKCYCDISFCLNYKYLKILRNGGGGGPGGHTRRTSSYMHNKVIEMVLMQDGVIFVFLPSSLALGLKFLFTPNRGLVVKLEIT